MSTRPWYKRYPSDFISGTLHLTLEQKGAYSIILDMIYDRGGPIEDNSQHIARVCGCSTRKWNQIRERLIEADKITVADGRIHNPRADKQLVSDDLEREKLAENGRKGAEKTNEKKAKDNKNNALDKKGPLSPERPTRSQRLDTRSSATTTESISARASPGGYADAALRLIETFDACRVAAWGDSQARPWPAGTDLATARSWLVAGLDPDSLAALLAPRMRRAAAQSKQPPAALAYFEQAVRELLAGTERAAGAKPAINGGGKLGSELSPEERLAQENYVRGVQGRPPKRPDGGIDWDAAPVDVMPESLKRTRRA